jgi:hypothetical protein
MLNVKSKAIFYCLPRDWCNSTQYSSHFSLSSKFHSFLRFVSFLYLVGEVKLLGTGLELELRYSFVVFYLSSSLPFSVPWKSQVLDLEPRSFRRPQTTIFTLTLLKFVLLRLYIYTHRYNLNSHQKFLYLFMLILMQMSTSLKCSLFTKRSKAQRRSYRIYFKVSIQHELINTIENVFLRTNEFISVLIRYIHNKIHCFIVLGHISTNL